MARKSAQLQFQGKGFEKQSCFGGSKLTSNPKTCRPLDTKLPLHLVLRARQGGMRNPKCYSQIHKFIYSTAEKYGVRIYEYANVGNHIHFVLRVTKRMYWKRFIRELTGKIALYMKSAVGFKEETFWLYRPFTRVVGGWKKAFQTVKEYIHLNELEACGHINRKETKTLKDLRAIWDDG